MLFSVSLRENHSPNKSSLISCTHIVTQSLRHSLSQSLSHLATQSVTQLLCYPVILSLSYSFSRSITHLLNHSVTRSLSHLVNQSRSHSFTESLTYSLTYSLTHSLIYSLPHSTPCSLNLSSFLSTQLLTESVICSFLQLLSRWLTGSLALLIAWLLIHSLTPPLTHYAAYLLALFPISFTTNLFTHSVSELIDQSINQS